MDAGAAAARPSRRDRIGTWFADERGIERRMKVSWHPERRLFVLSLWHGDTCTATFRLPLAEVPRLVSTLVDVLGQAAGSAHEPRSGPPAKRASAPAGGLGAPSGPRAIATRARELSQTWPEAWRRRRRRG